MKKIQINNSFFNLDSPLSIGLISGLKKLSQKGFLIFSDGIELSANPSLQKILKNEGIEINKDLVETFKDEFIISTDDIKSEKSIFVSEKSKVRNFGEAADEILKRIRSSS
ncbi:MAG: hypothetical protein ACM34O_03425, partial [Ignavibacteria bacterium]